MGRYEKGDRLRCGFRLKPRLPLAGGFFLPPPTSRSQGPTRKIFEHETALASAKGPTAFPTGQFSAVRRDSARFNTHELVFGTASRALKRDCFSHGHGKFAIHSFGNQILSITKLGSLVARLT